MKVSCRYELPPFARAEKEPFSGETVSTLNPVPEVEVTPVEGSVSEPPFASKVLSLIRDKVKLVPLVVGSAGIGHADRTGRDACWRYSCDLSVAIHVETGRRCSIELHVGSSAEVGAGNYNNRSAAASSWGE